VDKRSRLQKKKRKKMLPNLSQLARTDGIFARSVSRLVFGEAVANLEAWNGRNGRSHPEARYVFFGVLMGKCFATTVSTQNETARVRISHNRSKAEFAEADGSVTVTVYNCTVDLIGAPDDGSNIADILEQRTDSKWTLSIDYEVGTKQMRGNLAYTDEYGETPRLEIEFEAVPPQERTMNSETTWKLFRRCD